MGSPISKTGLYSEKQKKNMSRKTTFGFML